MFSSSSCYATGTFCGEWWWAGGGGRGVSEMRKIRQLQGTGLVGLPNGVVTKTRSFNFRLLVSAVQTITICPSLSLSLFVVGSLIGRL